jgi:HEAT repeat protein
MSYRNNGKGFLWVLLLVIGLSVGLPYVTDWYEGEPQNLQEAVAWLTEHSHRKRNKATAFIQHLGPQDKDKIPVLVQALNQEHPEAVEVIEKALDRIGPPTRKSVPALLKIVEKEEGQARAGAVRALGQAGPDADEASSTLARILLETQEGELTQALSEALTRIGAAAADDLVQVLLEVREPQEEAEDRVLNVLYRIGVPAALPALHAGAQDNDPLVREGSIRLLGKMASEHPPTVSELIGALKDSHATVRQTAARALRENGKVARPFLLEALEKEVQNPKELARAPGEQHDPSIPDVIPHLLFSLTYAHEGRGESIRQEQTLLGPAIVPALIDILSDRRESSGDREQAMDLLATLGRDARSALPPLRQTLDDPDPSIRASAAEALARFIPQVANADHLVRALLNMLDDKSPDVRSRVVRALRAAGANQQGELNSKTVGDRLLLLLEDKSPEVQSAAIQSLVEMGEHASRTVPWLLKELQTTSSDSTLETLGQMGPTVVTIAPAAVDVLLRELEKKRDKANIISVLGQIQAERAVPALRRLLDNQPRYREELIEALGQLQAKEAVPDLLRLLDDPESTKFRSSILTALGHIRPEPQQVLPRLIAALADHNLVEKASWAIGQLDPSVVPTLIALLQEQPTATTKEERKARVKQARTRYGARQALAHFGAQAEPAIPHLIRDLKNGEPGAVQALSRIGKPAVVHLGRLLDAKTVKDARLRAIALVVLGNMEEPNDQAKALILEAWKDNNPEVRAQAVRSGIGLKWDALQLREPLKLVLGDESPRVRSYAAQLLAQLPWPFQPGKETQSILERFRENLKKEDSQLSTSTLQALAGIAPSDPAWIRKLIALTGEREDKVSRAAIVVLGEIGTPAVVPLLAALKAEEDLFHGWMMVRALGEIGPKATDAVPLLIERINASLAKESPPHELTITWEIAALGQIGPSAKAAVPVLAHALMQEEYTRREAAQALGNILRIDPPPVRELRKGASR